MIRFTMQHLQLGVMVLITLVFGALLPVVARLGMPSDYLYEIKTYSSDSDQGTFALPQVTMGTRTGSVLTGTFDVPENIAKGQPNGNLYAYIPKFEGELDILVDGNRVLTETSPADMGGSGFALFSIPVGRDGVFPRVDFKITEKAKKFVLASNVFLGAQENFLGSGLVLAS